MVSSSDGDSSGNASAAFFGRGMFSSMCGIIGSDMSGVGSVFGVVGGSVYF
jgi:hypothetical protein